MSRLFLVLMVALVGLGLPGVRQPKAALVVSGSTAMLPFAERAAAQLGREGVRVDILSAGSLFGLAQVHSGTVDLALSDVAPPPGLWSQAVARLPVAVIAHPGSGLQEISRSDLRAILEGAVTNWATLGGRPWPLVLFFRTAPSGLRAAVLQGFFGSGVPLVRSVNALSNGDVLVGVRETPGGIGLTEGVLPGEAALLLKVEGKLPGEPGYPLWITAYAVLRSPPEGAAKLFLSALKETTP